MDWMLWGREAGDQADDCNAGGWSLARVRVAGVAVTGSLRSLSSERPRLTLETNHHVADTVVGKNKIEDDEDNRYNQRRISVVASRASHATYPIIRSRSAFPPSVPCLNPAHWRHDWNASAL